jgi:hypothetical protein
MSAFTWRKATLMSTEWYASVGDQIVATIRQVDGDVACRVYDSDGAFVASIDYLAVAQTFVEENMTARADDEPCCEPDYSYDLGRHVHATGCRNADSDTKYLRDARSTPDVAVSSDSATSHATRSAGVQGDLVASERLQKIIDANAEIALRGIDG